MVQASELEVVEATSRPPSRPTTPLPDDVKDDEDDYKTNYLLVENAVSNCTPFSLREIGAL